MTVPFAAVGVARSANESQCMAILINMASCGVSKRFVGRRLSIQSLLSS